MKKGSLSSIVSESPITLATTLTLIRIVLIPWIAYGIVAQRITMALFLLALAAVTDVLDGWIARRYGQQTPLGALLDPLADKILTIIVFGACVYVGIIPHWFFVVCVLKELVQMSGALIVYHYKKISIVHAHWTGKAAMVAQVVLILVVLLGGEGWYIDHIFAPLVAGLMVTAFLWYSYYAIMLPMV